MKTIRVEWSEKLYYASDINVDDLLEWHELDESDLAALPHNRLAQLAAQYAVESGLNENIIDSNGVEDSWLLLIDGKEPPKQELEPLVLADGSTTTDPFEAMQDFLDHY